MTKGYKWKMFVLQLSFIGWYFLGALLFGIGQTLVLPYVDATFAQLYLQLRENVVSTEIVDAKEHYEVSLKILLKLWFRNTAR